LNKSTTITLVALLTIALILPQTLAATSQGLFYRMEDGDRFYFTMEIEEDGVTSYNEIIYFEIENSSKPIPDPLTNLTHLDYLDVDLAYENGSSMGLLGLIFLFVPQLVYPVGNWNLLTTLAGTDLESLLTVDAYDITINQNEDSWGFSYKYEDSVDTEVTIWLDYSKFDGMLSSYDVELRNTTSSEILGQYDIGRFSYHNLKWGCSDGDTFDYHLVITGQIGTMGPTDEDLYIEIFEEGLTVIPITLTDLTDIPNFDGDIFFANDTVPSIDYFDSVIRLAVPIGNWTLMDDLVDAIPFPGGVDFDAPDPWFWGFNWSVDMGDIIQEVHTDYLKVDGMVARHTVTIVNATTSEWMGTISLERTGLQPYTDRTDPVINHPVDVEFVEGAENQSIVWGLIDDNPTTYEVSVNGTVVDSGSWTSGDNIVLDLDDFEAGEHTCVITAYDIAGNSATDSVLVTVTAADGSLTDLIMDNILYIAIGAGAIILIGAVVLMRRRS